MMLALHEQCEAGQQHLMQMNYLQAEAILEQAEQQAWRARDWDALTRLYMPLQEARRQRRQRCGEGIVCLDLLAENPGDALDARHVVENYPHGQLLVAGWESLAPAAHVRALAREHELYVETFLGAVYHIAGRRYVAIVPTEDTPAPGGAAIRTPAELLQKLPPHSLVLAASDLPAGSRRGNSQTYGQVMALWEKLHTPFLAAADDQADPLRRMEGYRQAIKVDYACELAHQKLSDTARAMLRVHG